MGYISFGGLVGVFLLLVSGAILWSGTSFIGAAAIRSFIERRFLGGKDLHDPNARYAKDVKLLGVPLLVTALTTIIPMTNFVLDAKLLLLYASVYLVITIGYWLYQGGKHAVRWLKASADIAEHQSAKLNPKTKRTQS
jgi:hypothetical protein